MGHVQFIVTEQWCIQSAQAKKLLGTAPSICRIFHQCFSFSFCIFDYRRHFLQQASLLSQEYTFNILLIFEETHFACLHRFLSDSYSRFTPNTKHPPARRRADESAFALRDAESESKWHFSLSDSLARAQFTPLFADRRVHVTPSVKPGPDDIATIVGGARGTRLAAAPKLFVRTQKQKTSNAMHSGANQDQALSIQAPFASFFRLSIISLTRLNFVIRTFISFRVIHSRRMPLCW